MESSELFSPTVQDRCDSCGSRAYVKIVFPATGHDLLLCGHHFKKHQKALELTTATIMDESALLTAW